jgi:hypothetical protein
MTAQHVPVEVEHRLPRARADVDDDAVVLEARVASRLGDEVEHPLRLAGREFRDVAQGVDVSLGDHEQVRRRLRRDVADRDEAVGARDMVALAVELAELAIRLQRELLRP